MVDITYKTFSLRKAIAMARVETSSLETVQAVLDGTVPKGNVFEFARAATLLAIKKTSDIIPDCHPLPVEYAAVSYNTDGLAIEITVEVHTIYKTGVEVEAMHGASVAALVIYDMLKPIDKKVEIGTIKLCSKTGGKSGNQTVVSPEEIKSAVVVCSDSVSRGDKQDTSGRLLVRLLEEQGVSEIGYSVVADDIDAIQSTLKEAQAAGVRLLIFTGGTGLSDRDVTPEAVLPFITKEIPGIAETARQYGQQMIKTAMLSRVVAGFANDMLVMTFPGSPNAVREFMQVLFPHLWHVFHVKNAGGH
ncbi:bifunctional molybdenum cofactor biosynthesis protein MoaC/MoaB [Sphingobacterium sp. lm-10]|uniref:bifunctional molybdenum cofactor biosynthesis protein MoaC/MoaB n=1 Tax=Sphingobacterium sp. lm-10 TaxID=2944904 RepID=UPI002020D5BB|nr:bifunctional molybdenum cofactor biosynthesis protein MoaC/MoaB [Sphingobacterium sp. lm-10]MCL7986664.1 bifunctional molybdenum cofactor biosynthesis protein MoaC/MoaB [Sphingobacterium sp. lm-10]